MAGAVVDLAEEASAVGAGDLVVAEEARLVVVAQGAVGKRLRSQTRIKGPRALNVSRLKVAQWKLI